MDFTFTDLAAAPDLFGELDAGIEKLWPPFMLQDPVAHAYFMAMVEEHPAWQLVLLGPDGRPAGGANALPITLGASGWLPDAALPEEGWDWALETAIEQGRAGLRPDAVSGLQIAVFKEWQGKGLSHLILAELRRRVKAAGLPRLVIPVRPTRKALYPLIPMADYAAWKRADGLPFDPWIRVHARAGAAIKKPCARSMRIEGSRADWEGWAGMALPGDGAHVLPGALAPVVFEGGRGVYVEPNLWMEHLL